MIQRIQRILCLSLLLVSWQTAVKAQTLQASIETLMQKHDFLRTSEVGIVVYDLSTGDTLYAHQADKLFRPASVQKVITSVTALSLLGAEHRFSTRLTYTGNIENGVLKGDLYVVGDYDPEFNTTDLFRLSEAVQSAGIRHIEGHLYGDVSLTDAPFHGPGWSWDDAPYTFMPYLSPLMLEKGTVRLSIYPSARNKPAYIEGKPVSSAYSVVNKTMSKSADAGRLTFSRDWTTQNNTITVSGNVKTVAHKSLSVFDTPAFFLTAFMAQLREMGVSLADTTVAYAPCPIESTALYTLSRPMTEALKEALKESDNLSAEALFAHIGIYGEGRHKGSFERSSEVVSRFSTTRLGIDADVYKIADGCGLSPYNLVSPYQVLAYLRHAYLHPQVYAPFYDALPVSGVDGTLKNRMKQGKTYRSVRAKTGAVTGVSALAGYLTTEEGKPLAFVVLHQNLLKVAPARAFQDELCELLVTVSKR